ncbi:MAG: integrin, partial [Gammaproteobacteria bacterium]|nr:integrin [Gammaproteobacteria bacterium]
LTLAITSYLDRSNSVGINALHNALMTYSGAVYVFVFDGTNWSQQAYVKASNTNAYDYFGVWVDINDDGSRLVVDGFGERSSSRGINGEQTNNSMASAGAVYLFYREGGLNGIWSQHSYIKATNTQASDGFRSARISGDGKTLAVGARGEDSNATGIGGDETNNSFGASGAVYLY